VVTLAAVGVGMLFTPGATLVKQFRVWDGGWYLNIATGGYARHIPPGTGNPAQANVAFFPLFPLLIRGVHSITGLGLERSGALVVFAFGAAATVGFWLLARRLRDEETADRAAALFAFFPGTIVFSLLYAEPVAICFAIFCCLFLLEERWVLAGVCGALATAARPNAAGVVAAAALAAYLAYRQRRSLRPFVAVLLAPLGAIGFFLFLWQWTGSWRAWLDAQRRGWHDRFVWDQSWIDIRRWLRHPGHDVGLTILVVTTVFGVIALVLMLRTHMPIWLKVYGLVALAFTMTSLGTRPRFLIMAFPIFIGLADRARHTSLVVLAGSFAGLLALYTVLMSTPFYPFP
jgi:Gpi18-like mannosyltransferase